MAIRDIDGDGFPDYLKSSEDKELKVALSTIGRSNLLKKVSRPMGSSIALDYERSGNTFEQPQGKQVLKSVLVYDGQTGDAALGGADHAYTTFAYEGGRHDRWERDFYGYFLVKERQHDTRGRTALGDILASPVYRTIERVYATDSYYQKGLLESESAQAAAHAQNTVKNPHYADPSLPLTVVQENTQIDAPAYADWEYAFPESFDVATIGGGSEHLYFYHADHLGSTGYVTREDAALVEHVQYFPFGETWIQEGKHTERYPYLFTSKELDEESGLYYFGARYYDPRTSVWQSPDPALGEYLPARVQRGLLPGMGGIYNSFNLGSYTYAHLSPLKVRDPDGRIALVDDAIIGASIIVIGGTAYVMSNPENRKAIARQVGQGIENFETNTQRAIEKIKNIFYNEQGNTEESNSDTGKAQSNPAKGRDDTEHSSYDDALKGAREKAGNLGEDAEKMYDPETGTQIGEQSADSKRGWRIDDNHVNWWDWSGGKKGQGGKYGHEFFPEEQAGPHSKYPGYSEWE